MNEMAWSVALALSSVIMGVASLWALFRPMATGIARKVADDLKQNLKTNEFHDVGVQMEQLDDRIDQMEGRLDKRIDQLDARLTGAISEVRTDLGRMHETQGRILEAIRAISPVG